MEVPKEMALLEFLKPILLNQHMTSRILRSSLFIRLEVKFKQMVADFWKGHCHLIGFQPIDLVFLKAYKEGNAQPSHGDVATAYNQVQGSHRSMRPAANLEQDHGGSPPVQTMVGPPPGFGHNEAALDSSPPTSIDQIREENIKLFVRCEEHKQEESKLKEKIQILEQQVMETRTKCDQLSAHLERKKQNLMHQGFR